MLLATSHPHLDSPTARSSLTAQAAHFFTYASPLILLVNALGLLTARVAVGGLQWLDAPVLVVTAAWWPLQEWLFHRVLLHMKPRRVLGMKLDPVFARAHRAHHRRPWIVEQTLIPVGTLAVLVPAQALWLLVPSEPLALTAAATYAASALLYEWIHYLCHSHFVPRSTYYRRIHRNHRLHHFKNERFWFSFTVPSVDTLFGTDPAAEAVPISDTVRTLGVDEQVDP
ncbi:MAG: sterol desaturase family protein [Deltaproteobacteria bacterium]|nr:sterol desaturase family protein [Deltaproteobacteria bacterium]